MDLTITDFERFISESCHAKVGGNWTANKGETEGGGRDNVPPAFIITKYLSLNRVNLREDIFRKLRHTNFSQFIAVQ